MMDVLVPAILAAAISGVFAAYISHKLNERKEKRNFKREKAEELYLCFEKWTKFKSGDYLMIMALYKGGIELKDYLDDLLMRGKEFDSTIPDRIRMIIYIYFPELKANLAEVTELYEMLQRIYDDYVKKFMKTGAKDHQNALTQHGEGVRAFAAKCEDMRAAIIAVASLI